MACMRPLPTCTIAAGQFPVAFHLAGFAAVAGVCDTAAHVVLRPVCCVHEDACLPLGVRESAVALYDMGERGSSGAFFVGTTHSFIRR